MSSTYNLEPSPTAKVILHTTSGEISLELFAKQTPLASRNFLQLCLDGYYDGTIFHRLVPGFVIQGGDPTGTGEGGEAIYDNGVFADEFHSRLKFNRRGLLGMANTGSNDDNGSQFFLTLGKTEELNGKNTMFGRVVGDTIYNLMKMGEADLTEVEGSERPMYPTKITGTEILVNPFGDMMRREVKIQPLTVETTEKKKAKKKAGKALLSFVGNDDDPSVIPVLKRAKFNPKLVKEDNSIRIHKKFPITEATSDKPKVKASPAPRISVEPQKQLPLPDEEKFLHSSSSSPAREAVDKVSSLLERTNAQIAELKASMKRNVARAEVSNTKKKTPLEQMIPVTATRGRKRKLGQQNTSKADAQALKMLKAFRSKLEQAPIENASRLDEDSIPKQEYKQINGNDLEKEGEEAQLCDLHFITNCQSCQSWGNNGQENEDDFNEDSTNWMSHSLNFERDRLGKDLTWKRKNEEELIVIDPLQKAKDIKEEQKKKRAQGTSKRIWDQDRDRGRLPQRINSDMTR